MMAQKNQIIKNRDIICFSSLDWDDNPTSKKHIMVELAMYNRVIYIETTGTRNATLRDLPRIAKRFIAWAGGHRKIDRGKKNLYVYSPLSIPFYDSAIIRRINKVILNFAFRKLVKNFALKDIIAWAYTPNAVEYIDCIRPSTIVYHCVDKWSTYEAGKRTEFLQMEKRLFAIADIVFVTSELLIQDVKPYNNNIHLIPNAADAEHFLKVDDDSLKIPDDISNIKKPIIGLVGAIASWVDFGLLKHIALKRPDWSIVLIGDVHSRTDATKVAELKKIKNIHFLGRKRYEDLPSYYKSFDVCIVPFILNEHIRYSDPTKIYEYMAVGRPIVATEFTAAKKCSNVIGIAKDKNDFLKRIEEALLEKDQKAGLRREIARDNTWQRRLGDMSRLITETQAKKNKPIKVLRIITRMNIGGPSVYAILLLAELKEDKFISELICGSVGKEEGDMSYLAAEYGVKYISVPELVRAIEPINDIISFYKIYRLIKKIRPDIVHTHMAKGGAIGRLMAKLNGVPVIMHTYHGHVFHSYFNRVLTNMYIFIERILVNITDKILTISEAQTDEIKKYLHIKDDDKITLIPLGLDFDKLLGQKDSKHSLRRELNIPDEALIVGTVGRLTAIKNIKMFLEAAREIKEKTPDKTVKFLVVGDGELRDELVDLSDKLGIKNDVIFTGWQKNLASVYGMLDVVTLTSLNEGTPVALIEALAMGRPAVATDVGGVRNVIEDGKCGFIVPSNDISAFSRATALLLNDKDKRESFGLYGKESVRKKYDKSRLIKDIEELYEQELRKK